MKNKSAYLCFFLYFLLACNDNTNTITVEVEVPPPEPVSTSLVIDVAASQLSGDFLLNSGAFPNSIYQSGDLFIRDQATGSFIELGNTYDHSYDVMLVNDTYDSFYRFFTGDAVPANIDSNVQTGVVVSADQNLDIDVPMVSVRSNFLLNGSSFPVSIYNRAHIMLQPVVGGDRILLGETHLVNPPVKVVAGEYHVVYQHITGDGVPANSAARVMSNVDISSDILLAVDVIAADVRTSFLLNGSAFPVSQYVHADFYLIDPATSDETFIGNSYDQPTTVLIISGTYNAEYRHQAGDTVPLNKARLLQSNIDLTSGGALILDVPSVLLNISATLNGNAFQVSEYQDGNLELFDSETGSYSLLGNTHGNFIDLPIIPGTYDFSYSHESGDLVPQNNRGTVLSDYLLAVDANLDLDVVAYQATSAVTINTIAFPVSQYQYANLILRGSQSTDDILLARTYGQGEPALVLPGSYDLVYQCVSCGDIPINKDLTLSSAQAIQADTQLSANIRSVRLEVSTTLNGAPFTNSIYQSGVIWGGTAASDVVELTATNQTTDDVILAEGDYIFYYQHANGDLVPINAWAKVDSQQLTAPPSQ